MTKKFSLSLSKCPGSLCFTLLTLKSPKTKTLADELIERTSSILDEIESKTVHKAEVGDQ